MAHIDRRNRGGTIRYVARYIEPTGRERSKSFTPRADAQKYLTQIEAAKLTGSWVDPKHGRTLFRDWHAEWWGSVVNLRPSTRLRDETYLRRYVVVRFGAMPLDASRQREVRAWVAWLLAQDLAPATVVKAYQLLSKVMTAAVDAGMLAQSPCRGIPLAKVEQEEMRFLDPAEIADLADAIHPAYRALVFVGAYGGLRIGELAALRRSRVDFKAGTVDVAETVNELKGKLVVGPPKTRASRRKVSLPLGVMEELAAHLRAPGRPPIRCSRCPAALSSASPTSAATPGGRQWPRPTWRACASTTFCTRRSRCGSPPAPRPRTSPRGPGTPRSASCWTATATCSPRPTRRFAPGWTYCPVGRRNTDGTRSPEG
jgi:integrase